MLTELRTVDFIALAALACYGLAVWPDSPAVVVAIAGTVLCFALTGVALAIAVLPRDVGRGAQCIAVVACSLAAGVVGGLILNRFPSGLAQFGWVTFALASTLIACAVARLRGVGGPVQWKRPAVSVSLPSWGSSIKVLASVFIVTAAIVLSYSGKNAYEKHFTELWLVPTSQDRSPLRATQAVLGIKSHEAATEEFTVVLDTSTASMTTRVTLAPNEVWTQVVPVEAPKATASLYRGEITDQPYRTVWINSE